MIYHASIAVVHNKLVEPCSGITLREVDVPIIALIDAVGTIGRSHVSARYRRNVLAIVPCSCTLPQLQLYCLIRIVTASSLCGKIPIFIVDYSVFVSTWVIEKSLAK